MVHDEDDGEHDKQDSQHSIRRRDTYPLKNRQIGAARRRTLADNAVEDAFFFSTDVRALGKRKLFQDEAAKDLLADDDDSGEDTGKNRKQREKRSHSNLFRMAGKFGGLQGAGEVLFEAGMSNPFCEGESATVSSHAAVAEQILVQDMIGNAAW